MIVCRDKSRFDAEGARKSLTKRIRRIYHYGDREWQYKNIFPQVIAEEYLSCPSCGSAPLSPDAPIDAGQIQRRAGLLDYKFMCFQGVVKALFLDIGVINDRGKTSNEYYRNIYDRDFHLLPVREPRANYPQPISVFCLDSLK